MRWGHMLEAVRAIPSVAGIPGWMLQVIATLDAASQSDLPIEANFSDLVAVAAAGGFLTHGLAISPFRTQICAFERAAWPGCELCEVSVTSLTPTAIERRPCGATELLRRWVGGALEDSTLSGQSPHAAAGSSARVTTSAYCGAVTKLKLWPTTCSRWTQFPLVMLAFVLALTACTVGKAQADKSASASVKSAATNSSESSAASSSSSAPSSSSAATGAPVHVSLLEADGSTYGVGMPIIAYFSASITDATEFIKNTTVTVNGAPAAGAWYFERSAVRPGDPIEGHYRLAAYWPAHATIEMNMNVAGKSAGPGFVFDDSLTLSMKIGAAQIATVDGGTEQMVVQQDGATVRTMPVSLGKASTPTFVGTKVVMGKANPERMVGTTPGDEYDLQVPWSVRITNSGEFIHDASWNGGNIGARSTSNGCTNLNPTDSEWYYNFAQIGDPVTYTNTGGAQMPIWDGYGDWNLDFTTWQAGGVVPHTG